MYNLTVERNVPVPMRDGITLRADVYRPAAVGDRFPVLLERTPYSKTNFLAVGMTLDPLRAASTGYAVVIQDTRGRFASEGEFCPFANESLDGYDTVEWCAEQPWSTGKVGMYGSSYMGATQWQAARERPPHLAAIVPNQSSSDYYEGRSYMGGVFELGSCLATALMALAPGSINRLGLSKEAARDVAREIRKLSSDYDSTAATQPLDRLQETALGRVTPYLFDWMHHDTSDGYWQAMSVEPHYAGIDVPSLHLTCWFDSFLKGALRNYEGMTAGGHSGQRLVVGPWTHHVPMAAMLGSARVGEMDCGVQSMIDFDALQLGWFDCWLKDKDTPSGPPVRLFMMGANHWVDFDAWPPPACEERLYLSSEGAASTGDGRLGARAGGADYDTFVYDPSSPVPTLGGNQVMLAASYPAGSYDQRCIEARDDVLVYTSDALQEDLPVAGWVSLTLRVTSSAPDTDFIARLTDVCPGGRSFNICEGARRLALRESLSERTAYSPGDVASVTIDMNATGHVFRKGHRVRLQVTSSNFPRLARNLNTGEPFHAGASGVPARQQVLHSSAHQSYLSLPVLDGGR
jgi:putative CocE/NonD family hydrolase